MKKKLQIINIDGTEGAGKSTQINMLATDMRLVGFDVLVNRLDDTIESALECSNKTNEFLKKSPDGLVINDGSIARMIVSDLSSGMSQHDAIEKYRPIIHEHEKMFHKYGTANILIILDDFELCNKRLKREAELLGNDSYKQILPHIENVIIQGLRKFDANMITNNLKFLTMEIHGDNTILEIKDSIIKKLEDNFEIKKPQ